MFRKKKSNNYEYLILKRKLHWKGWEFPKGGCKPKENYVDCIKRELKEETKNKPLSIIEFNKTGKWKYPKKLPDRENLDGQSWKLFAAELLNKKIKIDKNEHSDYKWLSSSEARKMLTYKNQKTCLNIVNNFLIKMKTKKQNFRKFTTTSGKKVLAGKNEENNEDLIEQVKSSEIVLHTALPGSPFVNIKGKAGKKDIKEAAIFCAKFSQAWKKARTKKDIEVHYFLGKNIYKDKTMKTGTFGVKKPKKILVTKRDIEEFETK